ncbi:hypothetical protein K502DRAFT_145670 [Neoconidiobolus thromboides FSU 785]|nr:hypothetical protein K502DRAFT_145670 [Neoconidiobolus thromboides FSU 785]
MGSNFKLEQLEPSIIKYILLHLPDKDKVNLLACCKKWNKIIMPILWEDMTLSYHNEHKAKIMETFKKYSHYIKRLDLRKFSKLHINPSLYPNSRSLYLRLDVYLKHIKQFKSIPLRGLWYTTFIGDATTKGYIEANKINIEEVVKSLKLLTFENLDSYFATSIIPILPSTITTLVISFNYDNEFPYFKNLIDKLDGLKELELSEMGLELEEFNYFLNKQLKQLKKLYIKHIDVEPLDDICINLTNYPRLEAFYFYKFSTLIFNGESNLKELTLNDVSLAKTTINNQMFPTLKLLSLRSCFDIEPKHLYAVFNMSTITFLNLLIYDNPIYEDPIDQTSILLNKEIYPKSVNNMITLKVEHSSLKNNFFDFLYTSCHNLYNLEVSNCHLEVGIPFSNYEKTGSSTLTNVIFKRFRCSNFFVFIDYFLVYFKNIKFIKFIGLEDIEFYAKYKDDSRFFFEK